jgi:hypothetical protein
LEDLLPGGAADVGEITILRGTPEQTQEFTRLLSELCLSNAALLCRECLGLIPDPLAKKLLLVFLEQGRNFTAVIRTHSTASLFDE